MFELYEEGWALVALACGLVLGSELINTALERLCDGLEPGRSPVVKAVKDLAAGAVLVCAFAAAAVAAAAFWMPVQLHIQFWGFDGVFRQPAIWAGAAGVPFWAWFVFWFGKAKG
jgi:hypothetical protein